MQRPLDRNLTDNGLVHALTRAILLPLNKTARNPEPALPAGTGSASALMSSLQSRAGFEADKAHHQ
jgi:hypothetical protein